MELAGQASADRRERFLFLFTAAYVAPFFVLALHARGEIAQTFLA